MKFSTAEGEKEGLTMLSTLLCYRGGIITIEESGQSEQIYIDDTEVQIQIWINTIEGEPVSTTAEMFQLSTVEILARLIYQEQREAGNGQHAVMFSIMNRLFSEIYSKRSIKDSNNIYSVITASSQYEAVLRDGKQYPNAFQPPIKDSDNDEEKCGWENAQRLAAILFVAIEKYGENNENANVNTGQTKDLNGQKIYLNDRDEKVVSRGDNVTRDMVIDFIEGLSDATNINIRNEIDTRINFLSYSIGADGEKNVGDNIFFW